MLAIRKYMDRVSRRVRGERMDSDEGFSLAELLVVVGIIAVLAVIAVPMYLNQQDKAKDSAAVAELRQAKTGVAAYAAENGVPSTGVTPALLSGFGISVSPGALSSFTIQFVGGEHVYSGTSASGKTCTATDSTPPACP